MKNFFVAIAHDVALVNFTKAISSQMVNFSFSERVADIKPTPLTRKSGIKIFAFRATLAAVCILAFARFSDAQSDEYDGSNPAKENSIVLSGPGLIVEVEVEDQFVGIPGAFTFKLLNQSDVDYINLDPSVDCSCIGVEGLQGKEIKAGGSLEFRVVIDPREGEFSRKITVRATLGKETVGELFTLKLMCKCSKAVAINQHFFLKQNDPDSRETVVLHPETSKIQLRNPIEFSSKSFKVVDSRFIDNGDVELTFVVEPTAVDADRNGDVTSVIKVPYTFLGVERTLIAEEQVTVLSKHRLEVAPRTIRLKAQPQGVFTCQLVVADYRSIADKRLGNFEFYMLDENGGKKDGEIKLDIEKLSRNRFIIGCCIGIKTPDELERYTQLSIVDAESKEVLRSLPIEVE